MHILGIDPGIARTGFGLLSTKQTDLLVTCGCIETPASMEEAGRYRMLGEKLETVLNQQKPDVAVIERVFFGANVKTAVATAEASGVIQFVLAKAGVQVKYVIPAEIKATLTGNRRASKRQVQEAVRIRLRLKVSPTPDDTADALGAALCLVA